MQNIDKKRFGRNFMTALLASVFYLFVILSTIWLCLTLWVHQPFGRVMTYILIACWIMLSCSITGFYITQAIFKRSTDVMVYLVCFSIGLVWYFAMPPRNDREWDPEVAKIMNYQHQGNQVTIENVRNFNWRSEKDYDVHWETRQYDLSKLQSMDLILSYWAGNLIAHTLVSFNFSDGRHLAFSIEIRKKKGESFSAIGGFFRQFELALIPADEKDIIYTRSNIRQERVYIYPVEMSKTHMQELFIYYLEKGQALRTEPRWYNTLISNCTTLIFDMMNRIEPVPVDYRVLLSGLLPQYLYDHDVLDHKYNLDQWRQMAHINPKVEHFEQLSDQSSAHFSQMIRSGLPAENH